MDLFKRIKIVPVGDSALLVRAGNDISPETNRLVRQIMFSMSKAKVRGVTELVPAYADLMVYYDPMHTEPAILTEAIRNVLSANHKIAPMPSRLVHIPVVYGGEFGPDLEEVAQTNNISPGQVVSIHAGNDYTVYMMGFSPGFCYLGGMDERISCMRKASPRLNIPAGAVGIAGNQTGIYPIDSPGGWQLIGRTPVKLFRPDEVQPFLVQAGDRIRFVPVSPERFDEMLDSNYEPFIELTE